MRTTGRYELILAPWMLAALTVAAPGPVLLKLERLNPCGYWRVTLYESGEATGELYNSCHAGGPKSTSTRQMVKTKLAIVQRTIEQTRFMDLPEGFELGESILDDDMCVIEVRAAQAVKHVVVSGVQFTNQDPAVGRFRAVWEAVNRLVPEPAW